MNSVLTRQDLISTIQGIIDNTLDRDAVSAWAFKLIDDDATQFEETAILDHLIYLGALDLPSTDRDYLYTTEDLKEWIKQLKNQ